MAGRNASSGSHGETRQVLFREIQGREHDGKGIADLGEDALASWNPATEHNKIIERAAGGGQARSRIERRAGTGSGTRRRGEDCYRLARSEWLSSEGREGKSSEGKGKQPRLVVFALLHSSSRLATLPPPPPPLLLLLLLHLPASRASQPASDPARIRASSGAEGQTYDSRASRREGRKEGRKWKETKEKLRKGRGGKKKQKEEREWKEGREEGRKGTAGKVFLYGSEGQRGQTDERCFACGGRGEREGREDGGGREGSWSGHGIADKELGDDEDDDDNDATRRRARREETRAGRGAESGGEERMDGEEHLDRISRRDAEF